MGEGRQHSGALTEAQRLSGLEELWLRRFCGILCAHVGSGGPKGVSLSELLSMTVEGTGMSA